MNLVVAVDNNWAIGCKGQLLASVRADLRHFSRITTGHTVILGAKTLGTFPGGRPLKNRQNIILSTRLDPVEGALVAGSIDQLMNIVSGQDADDLFVIGGASVYRQLLPYCRRAFVTRFDASFEYDAAIPDLSSDPEWYLTHRGPDMVSDPATDTIAGLRFRFEEYRRRDI